MERGRVFLSVFKQIRLYAAFAVPPLLLILWLFDFAGAFRAELASVRLMGQLSGMSPEQRTALSGGAMYELTSQVSSLVPSGSRIFFFNPPLEGAIHYSGKARYYLYPVPIIEVNSGDNIDASEFGEGDYLVFFIPGTFLDTNFETELTSAIPSERVYGVSDAKGRQAIYRVTG